MDFEEFATTWSPSKSATRIYAKLKDIEQQLQTLQFRDLLCLIIICFIALLVFLHLIITFFEKRKKKKHDSVPQAIVIQPKNGSLSPTDKSKRKTKKKSTGPTPAEPAVLPSKTMKVKVHMTAKDALSSAKSAESTTGSEMDEPSKESVCNSSKSSKSSKSTASTKSNKSTKSNDSSDKSSSKKAVWSHRDVKKNVYVKPTEKAADPKTDNQAHHNVSSSRDVPCWREGSRSPGNKSSNKSPQDNRVSVNTTSASTSFTVPPPPETPKKPDTMFNYGRQAPRGTTPAVLQPVSSSSVSTAATASTASTASSISNQSVSDVPAVIPAQQSTPPPQLAAPVQQPVQTPILQSPATTVTAPPPTVLSTQSPNVRTARASGSNTNSVYLSVPNFGASVRLAVSDTSTARANTPTPLTTKNSGTGGAQPSGSSEYYPFGYPSSPTKKDSNTNASGNPPAPNQQNKL